jgi:RNA polymerase sigma factor (sigma-70 family)
MPPAPNNSADPLRTLASRAQSGDRSAFEQLMHRFDPGLKRLLLRRTGGDASLAEELAHETWIGVWQALAAGRYDPAKASISTFIYAVARKRWLQHLRRAGAAASTTNALDDLLAADADAADPAVLLQAAELIEAMRACLHAAGTSNSLSEDERRVIIGLVTGETERSLAAELGVAASTVHARKQLAFNKLQRCMAARGFALPDAERSDNQRE